MAKDKKVTKVPVETKPAPGVYVTRKGGGDKVMGFQGKYEAQLTPTGDIAILELVPDVGNDNDGNDVRKIRRFIAEGTWEDVVVVE